MANRTEPGFVHSRVECPKCATSYKLGSTLKGDEVRCRVCNFSFHVPAHILWPKVDYHPRAMEVPQGDAADPPPTEKDNDRNEPEAKEALRGLRIGPVDIPGWAVAILMALVVTLLVVCLLSTTAKNRVLNLLKESGATLTSAAGQIQFSRTFVFWVPGDSAGTAPTTDPFATLHTWLDTTFGGWTRWKVEGSTGTPATQTGWFYQASLPIGTGAKLKPEEGRAAIEAKVKECFPNATPYVVEQPHYVAGGNQ